MSKSSIKDIIIICTAVLALTLPFINQAFHLDDREFIDFGKAQLSQPLNFYLENYDYGWHHFDKFNTSHPPLLSSLLALVMWISGSESEPVLHGAYLIFPVMAAVAMYSLARRFTKNPLAATLLLITTPGFVVMSHTLRGDLPGLATWLTAAALYIYGVDRSSVRLLAAAGAFLVLAVATCYQCLSLVPLLFTYALFKRRLSLRTLAPLLAPVAAIAAFSVFFFTTTGELLRFSYRNGVSLGWEDLMGKARSAAVFIGAASIFPLAALPAFIRTKKDLWFAAAASPLLLGAGVAVPFLRGNLSGIQALLLIPALLAGAAIIYQGMKQLLPLTGRWHKCAAGALMDSAFLGIWILGVAAYVYLFLPYVAVRYLLPLFPPAIILGLRLVEDLFDRFGSKMTWALAAAVGATLSLALLAAVADYRLAGIYRDLAPRLAEQFKPRQQRVWFLGEFGFRYYMEREGFLYLGASADPLPGEKVIQSRHSSTSGEDLLVPPIEEKFAVKESVTAIEDAFPVRTRNPWAQAGFYSNRIGPVPVMPSRERLDDITVYRFQW